MNLRCSYCGKELTYETAWKVNEQVYCYVCQQQKISNVYQQIERYTALEEDSMGAGGGNGSYKITATEALKREFDEFDKMQRFRSQVLNDYLDKISQKLRKTIPDNLVIPMTVKIDQDWTDGGRIKTEPKVEEEIEPMEKPKKRLIDLD